MRKTDSIIIFLVIFLIAVVVFAVFYGLDNIITRYKAYAITGGPITCVENPTFLQHIHTHLTVLAGKDNHAVTVPQLIGFNKFLICSLHTHAPDGWIHIESMDPHAKYTLAQFLEVWRQTKPASFIHVFGSLNFDISKYNNTILRDKASLTISEQG